MSYDCIVVGAGISGLSAAYGLHRRGASLLLIEAGPQVGGAMRSEQTADGFMLENGPNTIVNSDPQLWQAFEDLGIASERITADHSGAKRYLLLNGKPEAIPMSPGALLSTPLISWPARLRMLAEPLMPRAVTPDESALSFFARRIGLQPARRLVDPFVSGVYAGDPASLSMKAGFPKLWRAEQKAGSLLLGMLTGAGSIPGEPKRPKGKRAMFSFRNGLSTWPNAIAKALGPERLWLNSRVTTIQPAADGWQVTVTRPNRTNGSDERVILHAAELVLAAPAYVSAELVGNIDPDAARALRGIPYPAMAVAHLGYRREDVAHPLDGFGMLCPSLEGRKILGSLWPSTLFSGRAPAGTVLTTLFMGGARMPEVAEQDNAAILALAHREQQDILGMRGEPIMGYVARWPRAIPQYIAGHTDRIAALERLESRRPGIYFLGNYRGGVSVANCWQNGQDLAARVRLPSAVAVG